jgi:hypothetical protein
MATWAQLGMHRKPIATFDVNGYWLGLHSFLRTAMEAGLIRPEYRDVIINVTDGVDNLLPALRAYPPLLTSKWVELEPLPDARQSKPRPLGLPGTPVGPVTAAGSVLRDAARSTRRPASSTAFRASADAMGTGSYWAGVLKRSNCASWRDAVRPSLPAVASKPTASSWLPPPERSPSKSPHSTSDALIPAVTALPAATSHRSTARLSPAASSQLRALVR